MIAQSTRPVVSICCITYNQEEFICETIDSFLMQKTNFPIEIIIHDDASTDKTAEIIKKYEKIYPDIIKPIFQTENQHSKGKKIFSNFVFLQAKGKYIALCEGDDYWTDPNKLQKQVDFLENNPDFSICFHKVSTLKDNKFEDEIHKNYYKEILKDREMFFIEDLLNDNFIATCSVVFQKKFNNFPEWYEYLTFGDWSLHILNAQFGKIKYIDEIMAVYRIHEKGLWTSKSVSFREESILKFYKIINKYLNFKYNDLIFERILNHYIKYVDYSSELLEAKSWFEGQLSQTQAQLSQTQAQLSQTLAQLSQTLAQLSQIYNSKTFKIACEVTKISSILLPKRSKRRNFFKLSYKVLIYLIKKIKKILKSIILILKKIKNKEHFVKILNKEFSESILLISVIIPCFNYGKYVEEAIDSVLNQTFQNFEIIVIDGGSTDSITKKILESLNKPKTKIIFREERHLVGDNRNYGINLAKGKYICCLDADDILDSTYLEKALFFLETYNYDVVHPGVQCFGTKSMIWNSHPTSFEKMLYYWNSVSTVAIFKKEAWEKTGGYKDWPIGEGYVPEDWEFWTRLLGYGYKFKNLKELLMYYRVHGTGLMAKCKTALEEQRNIIINENKNLLDKEFKEIRNKKSRLMFQVQQPYVNLKKLKNKKRILLALPFMIIGGADTILLKIFKSLKDEYDITIITTLEAPPECGETKTEFNKITSEIYHLPKFIENENEMSDFIYYLIESREIDVIFIVGCAFIYNMLPEIKKRYKNLRVVDQLFNEVGHIRNNRKYKKLIDLNIVANEKIREILINKYKESAEKIKVIIHGVDVCEEYNPEKYEKSFNLPCVISKDKLTISFFGRFSQEKGPDIFIRIVNELRELNIQAIMTGNGPEYNNVMDLIKSYGLSEIIYTPGFLDDIKPLILNSDIVIVPSRIDGLPIIILEALSFGVPIIASDVGGLPSIVINGYDGYICKKGGIGDFAERVKFLFENRDKLVTMKNNARKFAIENISEEKMNILYMEAIKNILSIKG